MTTTYVEGDVWIRDGVDWVPGEILSKDSSGRWVEGEVLVPGPTDLPPRMLYPLDRQDVTGSIYMEAEVPEELGATLVQFQVGLIDYGVYDAAQVPGDPTRWRSIKPHRTAYGLKDNATTTALVPSDFPTYIRPIVTHSGGPTYGAFVIAMPDNFKLRQYGTAPVWRPENEFHSSLTGTLDQFYAAYPAVFGKGTNPADALHASPWPTAVIVNDAFAPHGKMVKSTISDTKLDSSPTPDGRRWQCQSKEMKEGSHVFVANAWKIPTVTSSADPEGFPTPTNSHISIDQLIGTGIDPATGKGTSFVNGLRLMMHAHSRTSINIAGELDIEPSTIFVDGTDRGGGHEPALMIKIPFARGHTHRQIWELAISADPRKGWIRYWHGLDDDPLVPVELFGIPGFYQAPVALIERGGTGQDFHQHQYRGSGFAMYVTIFHSELNIVETFDQALASLAP